MAKQKVKIDLTPKGGKLKAVQPDVQLTQDGCTITLVTKGSDGNPFPVDAAKVTNDLTSSDTTKFTVAAGADSLHFTGQMAAGNADPVTITDVETFLDGSAGPFTASCRLLPPVPPPVTPVDVEIVVT
jgi:hypothetical protein